MSTVSLTKSISLQLSTRWQIPLLLFSLVLLATGIWRFFPAPAEPTFEDRIEQIDHLVASNFLPEASEAAENLLVEHELEPAQRQTVHRKLANIIFAYESNNAVHGDENVKRLLEHSRESLGEGEAFSAEMHRKRALAWEWLQRPTEALAEYRAAVAKGVDDIWQIRRRIIEIQRRIGGVASEDLHAAFDEFLSGADVPKSLEFWAAEQKVQLFSREGRQQDADAFLEANRERFSEPQFKQQYDYLRALSWYELGRTEDAERLLRSIRNQVSQADPLFAKTGWLLGRILQQHEAPEYALSFYEDVLENAAPGPFRTACMLGRGEVLADLQRYDASIESYEGVISRITRRPFDNVIDMRMIRESAESRYEELLDRGDLEGAMSYLRMSARLAPRADSEKQALYAGRLADLAFALGKKLQQNSDSDDSDTQQKVREYFLEAGREYLRLAKLITLQEHQSADATWKAADAFDEAGDRQQAAAVLEQFVAARPTSNRVPAALNRLGQTYQALGDIEKAKARYQRVIAEFPGTPAAVRSIIPLSECFVSEGELEQAEQTLLRLVTYQPGQSLRSVTPEAREYRDALFRLGDLYLRMKKYEEAISRYEESIERYGNDPRADRAVFMLAEAYRRSADRLYRDYKAAENVAYKDHLHNTYLKRLERAQTLYNEVIERYGDRPAGSLGELEQLYVKLSYFRRADAVFDLSQLASPTDLRPFQKALELYDRAAWVYQDDPMAMTAYIQIINCYLRGGNLDKARMTLQRAKWALKSITDEAFEKYAPDEDREYWQDYLAWLETTPTFTIAERVE